MRTSICAVVVACFAGAACIVSPLAMAQNQPGNTHAIQLAKMEGGTAATGPTQQTYLGVAVEPLHPAFYEQMGQMLGGHEGLLVARVMQDSPAEKAGIKQYDILTTFADQKLYSPEQLVGLVRADKAGQGVKLGIVRDGKRETLPVTLAERTTSTTGTSEMTPESRWHMPHWFSRSDTSQPTAPESTEPTWNEFDSMSLQSLGDNQYKAQVGYKNDAGKMEQRTFEGTLDEIRADVTKDKDLPANEQQHLLRALEGPNQQDYGFFPRMYYTPDGNMVWEFPNPNGDFDHPTMQNEF